MNEKMDTKQTIQIKKELDGNKLIEINSKDNTESYSNNLLAKVPDYSDDSEENMPNPPPPSPNSQPNPNSSSITTEPRNLSISCLSESSNIFEHSNSPNVISVNNLPTHSESNSTNYDTLLLGGGSIKGIMIIGAVQCAYDNYLLKDLKNFIGTSVGSIFCYLLAIGYTPIEIMVYICTNQLMEKMQHFNLVAMFEGRGASSFNEIQEQLEKMSIAKIGYLPTLNDLKDKYDKTLVCVTHNLTESRTEYLSWETHPHLPCITAIRMSSNLPLIFETYKYGSSFYVDGGLSDNFAIDTAEKIGKKILAITLEPNENNFSNNPDNNTLEFFYKLIFIPIQQSIIWKIQKASEKCNIIRIGGSENNNIKFFQFDISSKTKLEMFCFGYSKMREHL
jgi:predicted acylesterase/phospholipase RssA